EPPVTRSRRGTGFRDVLSLTRRSCPPLHNFLRRMMSKIITLLCLLPEASSVNTFLSRELPEQCFTA
ncbi:hypothetical protein, partial [Pectobacterium brasiliense]|uniref:hypothetical protein n=1 Tax=Pectobacterium brasiliense TaxID=180957 RepID=UPI001CA4EC20